jgi:hypothetical protein
MLDGWATQSLYAYVKQRVTGTVTGQTATIGPVIDVLFPPDFVLDPRPVRIEEGSFFTVDGVDYPITPVTVEQYNEISQKAATSIGPSWVYLQAGVPTGTLYFYPVSGAAVTLLCEQQITEFANLTTDYELPQGYKRALVYSFAEEIAPHYEVKPLPAVVAGGSRARRNIKRVNHTIPQLGLSRLFPAEICI